MNKPKILLSSDAGKINSREECDCACAYTQVPIPDVGYQAGVWGLCPDLHVQSFVEGYDLVFNTKTNTDIALVNSSAMSIIDTFMIPRSVRNDDLENVVQKMIRANLLEPMGDKTASICPTSDQIMMAWIHVTDRCNLRCAYCYLPHISEDMTLETGRAAVDATFRSALAHGFETVKLKYAGGEPLLRFPLILELHQYAQQLAAENDLELDGVVLSNGTLLTEEIITNLQSLNLRLMISLDGMGDWHDTQRPYAGGRGTFKDVAEAVELALDHALVPHISITVSGRNAEGLPEIIAWVLERDLPFSANFYRQNDLSVTHTDLKLEEEKIIAGMLMAFDVIEDNLPEHSLLASLTDRANLAVPHERTCSVGQDYLVFDQNGRVAKCQMKMNEAVADIHTEDPLQLIRGDQIGVQNISVGEKEGCRDCDWKFWCAGGCPLETFRATGRYDVQSPNCNIYKAIFPEVLRLEGLRLLKYAGELA
jgi:uncharacterized protein